jgi:uncharacterized protein (PEP-CTERM system associated)
MTGGPAISKIENTGETNTGFIGRIYFAKNDERGNFILSVGQNNIAGIESGEPLRSRGAALTITRVLTKRWDISVSALYNKYESFETDTQVYDEIQIGGGLIYRLSDWANLVLSYRYVDLNDNIIDTDSYINNIVYISLNLNHTKRL